MTANVASTATRRSFTLLISLTLATATTAVNVPRTVLKIPQPLHGWRCVW